MKVSQKSTFSTHLPNHKNFAKWHDGIARGGITAVWRALGLQTGIDPHRGSVGRRFRLLSRTAILIDGGTHYLSPLQLLAYVVLGSPELRGLRPDDWRALHDRAWRSGLTSEAPDGPVRLPPQRPRSPTPNPAPTDTPSPAIPPDEFSEFWRHRASPIAPPSSIANPISRFASSRRLKTAALYDLADREEIAFFTPSALPDRPDWLPAAMRWGLRGRTTHPSLVVPAWSLDGARTNLVARNLDHTTGPKATRATGIQAAGYLYANRLGREALAGRAPTDVIITEGETDWLLWASERPDLAVLGIYSGSGTPELAKRLAAATHAGRRIVLRTDRDTAGDKYAEKLTAALRLVGADLTCVHRALHHPNGTDDSDLWQAGQLDIHRPTADAPPLPTPTADLTESEPWANLPFVPLTAMRGQSGVLARAFGAALIRTDGIATGIATSTGSGKSFTAIAMLAEPAQANIVLLVAPGRVAAVNYRDAFQQAGTEALLYLGRAGSDDDTGRSLGLPHPTLGITTCENGQVLSHSRRGLDVSAACAACPLVATCEARRGTRGQRLDLKAADRGVVILTPQMLPAALDILPEDRIRAVVFDENPGPWTSSITRQTLESLQQHASLLRRRRALGHLADSTPEAPAVDALIDATTILVALLHTSFLHAADHAQTRIERGADIRRLHEPDAIQAAASVWAAAYRDPALSPRHRFPRVRIEALRLLEDLAVNATTVDILSASLDYNTIGRLTPARIVQIKPMPPLPEEVPVVFLDATPQPEAWQAVLGRPIEITGGRLMRHENERATRFHTRNHTATLWSASQRRLAADELSRELDALTPQLTTICRQRQGAGEANPLLVVTAWRNKLDLIERILQAPLEAIGFTVRCIHWFGTDYRGSNEYAGASVLWTLGTPMQNGDQQRLLRRAVQRASDRLVPDVAEETDWTAVTTGALAAITQAAGRARSTIDSQKRPTLFVHSGAEAPACITELISAGQGTDHGQLHANNRTAAYLDAINVPFLSQAFADPALTPRIPDEHRPSKSGIGRMITTLRAAGVRPVHLQVSPTRTVAVYPLESAGLDQLEHAITTVGLSLLDNSDEHDIPTNAMNLPSALGDALGIVLEPDSPPGKGRREAPWSPQVAGFAVYGDRIVEIDGLTETSACFDDGSGGVWLHVSPTALSRPTSQLWVKYVGREVSWRGSPAVVQGAQYGVVWLRCGSRCIGVVPEEIDPTRW